MKIIEKDPKKAEEEAIIKRQKEEEAQKRKKALKAFRNTPAHRYILNDFDESVKRLENSVLEITLKNLENISMLPKKEQLEKIVEMDKKMTIIKGVKSVLNEVKERIF